MTAVATRAETAPAVLDDKIAVQIRSAAPQFAPFLPPGVDVEQVVAAVFLEAQRVPAIKDCTPASIVSAASRLVQMGLDIGRTGYLVPFKGQATPVPSYKGLIELILATGAARSCEAREVRENDFFEFRYGSEPSLVHVPGQKNPRASRGKITHFYVVWQIKFGYRKFDVMTMDEVEDLRLRYSKQWGEKAWRRGEAEAWYGIKTVIIRSSKQLPQNPKLAGFFAALQADPESDEAVAVTRVTARVANDAPDRPSTPTPAPTKAEDAAARSETGEAATDEQIGLIDQLSNSHHFTAEDRARMQRKVRAMTKQQASTMIDGATRYIKGLDEKEAETKRKAKATAAENGGINPRDGLSGEDDDLPF